MAKVIVIDDQALEGKMISFVLARDCPCAVYAVAKGRRLETAQRMTEYLVISHARGRRGEREVLQTMELF